MLLVISCITLLFTGANYYILTRRITLFGGTMQTKYALLISLLITLGTIIFQLATFGSGKLFTIIGSLGSRLFILIPLVAVLTGCIHLIHLFCKPNPYLVLSFFLLLFAYGVRAAFSTKLTETTIITDKIPHDLKLMLVADFHVDDILSTVHLKELKRQIQLQQPDLVLIAGDFFNRANVRQAEYYKVLAGINVPMYAVEGNHDTMGMEGEKGPLALRHIADLTNIRFLYNESLTFPEWNLQLIGLEEAGQRKNSGLENALQQSKIQSGNSFNILLSHQPIGLRKVSKHPVDLALAGHTHKLQIRGLHVLSYLINDYTYGLYTDKGESGEPRHAFTTQGIGTRGLPVRLGTRSEIVMIHLLTNNS